ncbi:spore germination protein [Gracilibacillus halophilus YIM-C55.5]|uniref:Spore germination protein n=1 Tax=Gracilibacillus halophilus YIM-C55.5 TaxID=1308866 RepID=N4WGU7_9BACI|nr:spore germination protein [Gracilibacillus halophilus]ENH98469.1 spore germination protein [Gracilibacillus halophilus YIM-C55.5]
MRRSRMLKKESPNVSRHLNENVRTMKEQFSYGLNKDFSMRSLTIAFNQKQGRMFYYSSTVNGEQMNLHIIKPLLENEGKDITDIVSVNNIQALTDFETIKEYINSGKAVLFVDHDSQAYGMDIASFEHRNIFKAENENVIKGPQDAFTESLNANISLIRKQLHQSQLINEGIQVGERSKNEVNILYNKDLVNPDILENVRQRIKDINVDTVRNIELLEQYLEERPYSLIPTILYTEKPDKATSYLEDGFIILLMDTSAAALIVPVNFWCFFHTPEDRYLRFLYGNFSRAIRLLCFFLSSLISAIYVAVSNFHSEMIPPDLLLAITASRERVPFPLIFEVIIMEVAFELIREAGVRIPNPLGPTIGIVGALILGQAAVEANIISPIIVIIAAVSGLSSFALSEININFTIRISRFIFIFAAGFFGMLSLVGAFLLFVMYTASIKSFGVPYFSPMSPHFLSPNDTIFRKVIRREWLRPNYLKPKDLVKKRHR